VALTAWRRYSTKPTCRCRKRFISQGAVSWLPTAYEITKIFARCEHPTLTSNEDEERESMLLWDFAVVKSMLFLWVEEGVTEEVRGWGCWVRIWDKLRGRR
jgi:hypothetical protein